MGVREYAASFQLSPTSLRKWRDRLENAEVEIDWRAHLHPSARPVVGTSARQLAAESSLTTTSNDVPQAPTTPARRFFSDEQKLAIAIESGQPSPPDTTSSPGISWPLFISPLSSHIGLIESGP
jgi:hypothetical protein